MEIFPVIMSGGSGTRLWPMSRKAHPKQYLPLLGAGEDTLFQATLRRCTKAPAHLKVHPPSIIASADSRDLIEQQIKGVNLPVGHILLEPIARNTAVVASVASEHVRALSKEGLVLVLPADHFVGDVERFWKCVEAGADSARQGHIVTFGIAPGHPETGYGYIQIGDRLGEHCFSVQKFAEKPSLETAQLYLERGDYFWNAGIFMFGAKTMSDELDRHARDIGRAGQEAYAKAARDENVIVLNQEALLSCPAISIDYAVMEKTERAAIVAPVHMEWDDVGSWAAIDRLEKRVGRDSNIIEIDCDQNFILSNGRVITAVGLEGYVVVETEDAVLIVPKNRTQDVSGLVRQLKADGRTDLL